MIELILISSCSPFYQLYLHHSREWVIVSCRSDVWEQARDFEEATGGTCWRAQSKERLRDVLEFTYASRVRGLGMQEDRKDTHRLAWISQVGVIARETKCLAITLPWKASPRLRFITNSITNPWSAARKPRATDPSREPPRVPQAVQHREEKHEGGKAGSAMALPQRCFGGTAPRLPGKAVGVLMGTQGACHSHCCKNKQSLKSIN